MRYLFSIFLVICTFTASAKPVYLKLSDRIYNKYNKELRKSKKVFLGGSGGSFYDDIKKIFASYTSFERLSIEEARKLFVEIAEGYLTMYNQNEEIRPYLHNYPFTIDNLDIMIGFVDQNRKSPPKGEVGLVYVSERTGELLYRTFDHEKDTYIELYREPYEVAREIVMVPKIQK